MIIVSYDISDNKVRGRFAKFLMQYGDRLQYWSMKSKTANVF